jgi:hypothetical protein
MAISPVASVTAAGPALQMQSIHQAQPRAVCCFTLGKTIRRKSKNDGQPTGAQPTQLETANGPEAQPAPSALPVQPLSEAGKDLFVSSATTLGQDQTGNYSHLGSFRSASLAVSESAFAVQGNGFQARGFHRTVTFDAVEKDGDNLMQVHAELSQTVVGLTGGDGAGSPDKSLADLLSLLLADRSKKAASCLCQ